MLNDYRKELAARDIKVSRKGDFYVTYQADSLIYCYDEAYRPVACFGVEGTGMDKEYREFATKKETYENAREEISSRGFRF